MATGGGGAFDLPFDQHVRHAVRFNREAQVAHHDLYGGPVDRSDGTGYRSPIFDFVRAVRSHPDLAVVGADAALARVEVALLSDNFDNPWGFLDDLPESVTVADAQAEFLDVYDRIEHLMGRDPVAEAVELARLRPVTPPTRAIFAEYRLFVSIAVHLQEARPGDVIFLPLEKLAPILGVSLMTVSRYRKWAESSGILELVKAGRHVKGEAYEYRCLLTSIGAR